MSSMTCGCNVDYEGQRCAGHAARLPVTGQAGDTEAGRVRHERRDNDRDAEWCSCGQAGCTKYRTAAREDADQDQRHALGMFPATCGECKAHRAALARE